MTRITTLVTLTVAVALIVFGTSTTIGSGSTVHAQVATVLAPVASAELNFKTHVDARLGADLAAVQSYRPPYPLGIIYVTGHSYLS